ncbi:LysR substrate-binding domain-containing protein [Ramlibacter sp. AN1133]|uniref:LysR substrate-binding domain-containing protein n=1 Tax=Ramlibacter sp. AN1133 TaxID=3133429 RepID=UPI0030BFD11B
MQVCVIGTCAREPALHADAYALSGKIAQFGQDEAEVLDRLRRNGAVLQVHGAAGHQLAQGANAQVDAKDGQAFSKRVSGNLNVNHADSLVEAAIAGMGIVMISNFIAVNAITGGQLKPILIDYVAPGPKVYVVYPPTRVASLKLRAFIEALDQAVSGVDQAFDRRA